MDQRLIKDFEIPNKETINIPLLASDNIKKTNPLFRIFVAIKY